jgi:hypothetical protein
MGTCFVIQPFDGGKFDKRYDDIFAPAIAEAGLEPYRVDRDPNVEIPIQDIEDGIRNAVICFADITLDNPNVGFAISSGKPTVIVCSTERDSRFPFDIQHRSVIRYAVEAPSDFAALRTKIKERIEALLTKRESLQAISSTTDLAPVHGLSQQELIVLAAVAGNLTTPQSAVTTDVVRKDVESSGFTRMAWILGTKSLQDKKFISYELCQDLDGNEWQGYSLTEKGWDWVMSNQDKFRIQKPDDDAVPF